MARIAFSPLVESIVGKLAGSVFQDSYQGFQIRTRVSPRNPRTQFQQLRRGEFGFLSQLWRELSDANRQSWIDNAPAGMQGLNFYLQSNINLVLIGLDAVPAYISAATPDAFPLSIEELGAGNFTVKSSGIASYIPADTALLVQATAEKPAGKIFTNPSQYSPILNFPPGTDLSSPISISTEWTARYGQFTEEKRICIKSNLISTVNGARSDDSIICALENPALEMIYLAKLNQSGTSAPVPTVILNTLGYSLTFHYYTVGWYFVTSGDFVALPNILGGIAFSTVTFEPFSIVMGNGVPQIDIKTGNTSGTLTDGLLNDTYFMIYLAP